MARRLPSPLRLAAEQHPPLTALLEAALAEPGWETAGPLVEVLEAMSKEGSIRPLRMRHLSLRHKHEELCRELLQWLAEIAAQPPWPADLLKRRIAAVARRNQQHENYQAAMVAWANGEGPHPEYDDYVTEEVPSW